MGGEPPRSPGDAAPVDPGPVRAISAPADKPTPQRAGVHGAQLLAKNRVVNTGSLALSTPTAAGVRSHSILCVFCPLAVRRTFGGGANRVRSRAERFGRPSSGASNALPTTRGGCLASLAALGLGRRAANKPPPGALAR